MEIRVAGPHDAEEIARIYAPIVEQTTISFEDCAPSAAEIARRIETILPEYPWLVAVDDGGVAGYAYASRHRERAAYRWAADVSCYVAERARRRSIGKALYGALFELLSKQHYLRLYAGITLPNPASEALHRSVGFEPVGTYRSVGYKHGAWHDVRWYGLALGLRDVPLEPIPFARLYEVAQR